MFKTAEINIPNDKPVKFPETPDAVMYVPPCKLASDVDKLNVFAVKTFTQ